VKVIKTSSTLLLTVLFLLAECTIVFYRGIKSISVICGDEALPQTPFHLAQADFRYAPILFLDKKKRNKEKSRQN